MSDESKGAAVASIQPKLPWSELDTFARLNSDTGLVEVVHIPSGKLLAVVGDPCDVARADRGFQEIKNQDGDSIFVQVGVPLDQVPNHRSKFTYSSVMADLVCEKIAEGALITKVSRLPGMPPYSTLRRWMREHPDFVEKMNQAYKDRADYFSDKAIEVADELRVHSEFERNPQTNELGLKHYKSDADSSSAARTKIDLYLKQAAIGNQDRFGSKTKVTNDHTGQVTFVVETGIRREGNENFFVDESRKIREAVAPANTTILVPAKTVSDE